MCGCLAAGKVTPPAELATLIAADEAGFLSLAGLNATDAALLARLDHWRWNACEHTDMTYVAEKKA
jgi:hypothetical protein